MLSMLYNENESEREFTFANKLAIFNEYSATFQKRSIYRHNS